VKLGDTFVWCPTRSGVDHLWILISDPGAHEGKCVLINLTESNHGPMAYTLVPGQHRWIYKDTDVNFGDAFATTVDLLKAAIKKNDAVPHDPMDDKIVLEIIKRAKTHAAFAPILRKLLP
jgi:hypothetical protein